MGRASVDYASDNPDNPPAGIYREIFDGLVYFAGSGEHDTLTGSPVAEDVYSYSVSDHKYDAASTVNTTLPGNGTTDSFVHPVGSGGWDTTWDTNGVWTWNCPISHTRGMLCASRQAECT